jgi:translocation and assembly module TamB
MKKLVIRLLCFCALFALFFVGVVSFFLYTTPGLHTALHLSTLYFPGTFKIHQLKGHLRDQFSIDNLEYRLGNTKINVHQLTVNWHIRSLLSRELFIRSIRAQDLTIAINNKNILSGTLNLDGDVQNIHWSGHFKGPGDISINGTLKQLRELKQRIKWQNLDWPLSQHTILKSPEGRIEFSGNLPKLKIELSSSTHIRPKCQGLSAASLNPADTLGRHVGHDLKCSHVLINGRINAILQGTLPWAWEYQAHFNPDLAPPSHTESLLHTSLAIEGRIKDKSHGNLNLSIERGYYKIPENNLIPNLPFTGGFLKTTLTPEQLSGTGSLQIDADKQLNLLFTLPRFRIDKGFFASQPLFAKLTLFVKSFNFLQGVSPDLSQIKGYLAASLQAKGTLGKAQIESQLILSKASLLLDKLGLNLDPINISIQAKQNHWEAMGTIHSSGNQLVFKGQGPLTPAFNGSFSLQGNDFNIVKTREFQISISPQLNIKVTPTALSITGSILVPYAKITPQSLTNSIVLSDDVVFSKKKPTSRSIIDTSMDIQLEMGNAVELSFKGLHATLAGKVNIKKALQGPTTALGDLSVKEGKYKAYGQDLKIEQGQLLFTGGGWENPEINLRASKKISAPAKGTSVSSPELNNSNPQDITLGNNINIGVEVTGKLTAPKIQLFSAPSILSQADILSMLVLGTPASQASKARGQLLLAAISSMNLGSQTNGAQLLEQLKQNLGFDVNLQTRSKYDQQTKQVNDTTAVVVGKSLSKRVYLSYDVGMSQSDPNVLTLKYLLNKFISIQVSSSTAGNGIDFLYTSNKSKN